VEFGLQPPAQARWRGGILFDSVVRRASIGGTRRSRDRWAVASDVLALVPQGMMVIDSLFVPLFSDDWNADVAWQLSVIAAQSEALTGLLSRGGHFGIARERPDAVPCRRDASYGAGCFRGTTAGFPGGHAAGAMVGAGVVCVHHQHLPLYGGGFGDAAACGMGVGLGLASGYARMAAGRHYLTDTLAGIALGGGAGYLLPLWLHYRGGASQAPGPGVGRSSGGDFRWTIIGLPYRDAAGLSVYGWF
jgi:membrane-associated phospholipid phosphatase